jgi:hypothetical protein
MSEKSAKSIRLGARISGRGNVETIISVAEDWQIVTARKVGDRMVQRNYQAYATGGPAYLLLLKSKFCYRLTSNNGREMRQSISEARRAAA